MHLTRMYGTGHCEYRPTMPPRYCVALICMTLLACFASAEPGDLKHPDWHPGGKSLIAEGSCFGGIDLFLIDLDNDTVRLWWDGGQNEGYPRWFRDGKRVAFHQIDDNRQARLFIAELDEAGEIHAVRRLTDGPFDIEPAPSPDGKTIAFSRPGENGLDIALIDIASRDVFKTWRTEAADNFPSWYADGDSIVFHARNNDGTQIVRRHPESGEVSKLTVGKGPNMLANISPDGRKLVYSSERDGDREIYTRDLIAGTDTRLTERAGRDGYPKISPDGLQLAYHSVIDEEFAVVRIMNLENGDVSEFACLASVIE